MGRLSARAASSGGVFKERPRRSWCGVIIVYEPSSCGFESPNGLSLQMFAMPNNAVCNSRGVRRESPMECEISFFTMPMRRSALPCRQGESAGESLHSKFFYDANC